MRHSKRALIEVRNSFLKQYELAKKFNDKFYMEFFKKQIIEINEQLKEEK